MTISGNLLDALPVWLGKKKSVIVNMFCLMPRLSGESFLNMGDKFSEAARMEACADNLASK